MSKIQLTFPYENIINSIDLDRNSLPLNSSKRTANFRNNVFLSLRKFLSFLSPTHASPPLPASFLGNFCLGSLGKPHAGEDLGAG